MDNMEFDSIVYDYYGNTSSYVRIVLEMLPEGKVSIQKKQVIKELYNYFMNRFDDEKVKEIIAISSLFREKIAVSDYDSVARNIDCIYTNFLDKIVFNSINREKIFDIMNEYIKVYVGFYSEYQMDKPLTEEHKLYSYIK